MTKGIGDVPSSSVRSPYVAVAPNTADKQVSALVTQSDPAELRLLYSNENQKPHFFGKSLHVFGHSSGNQKFEARIMELIALSAPDLHTTLGGQLKHKNTESISVSSREDLIRNLIVFMQDHPEAKTMLAKGKLEPDNSGNKGMIYGLLMENLHILDRQQGGSAMRLIAEIKQEVSTHTNNIAAEMQGIKNDVSTNAVNITNGIDEIKKDRKNLHALKITCDVDQMQLRINSGREQINYNKDEIQEDIQKLDGAIKKMGQDYHEWGNDMYGGGPAFMGRPKTVSINNANNVKNEYTTLLQKLETLDDLQKKHPCSAHMCEFLHGVNDRFGAMEKEEKDGIASRAVIGRQRFLKLIGGSKKALEYPEQALSARLAEAPTVKNLPDPLAQKERPPAYTVTAGEGSDNAHDDEKKADPLAQEESPPAYTTTAGEGSDNAHDDEKKVPILNG
jgi:hypothetical protein